MMPVSPLELCVTGKPFELIIHAFVASLLSERSVLLKRLVQHVAQFLPPHGLDELNFFK